MPARIDSARQGPIAIDRKADVPVGVQLAWALCAQIRDGSLSSGQQLPTLRELAETTGLNVNTVRAVYRRLEQRGLIDSQQGSGTFVAAAPRDAAGALAAIAATAAHEARETGLDPRDVAAALYVAPAAARPRRERAASRSASDRSEATRRRTLRGQIATLERTLAELEADHPGVAPAPARGRRGIGPALLTVAELAQVRASLIRRLTVVQVAIDEHVDAERHERAAAAKARVKRAAKASASPAAKRTPREVDQPAASRSARQRRPRPTARPAPAGG
jgi:GntR family transcriptional regulator